MDVVIAGYGHAGELHAALLAGRPGIQITDVAHVAIDIIRPGPARGHRDWRPCGERNPQPAAESCTTTARTRATWHAT